MNTSFLERGAASRVAGMRTLRLVAALLLLCLPAAAQDGGETLVFTPQWTAQAQFAGYYVAEAKGFYRELTEERGKTPDEAMAMIRTGTREHARILLPWHDFPEETPPHLVQSADGRITEMYRQLIALRRAHKALIYGDFKVMDRRKGRFVYCRKNAAEEFVIECSLDRKPKRAAFAGKGYELVFANGRRIAEEEAGKLDLAALCPYEARIWKKL